MYEDYHSINSFLLRNNIHPILYGSLGASVYLGNFKEFGDIDLLIEDEWLHTKWNDLVNLMAKQGFQLIDAKEHEFENSEKTKVAFASQNILIRDNICDPTNGPVIVIRENIEIKTLSVKDFIRAYEFSVTDGYRINTRGKKDQDIINELKKLI